MLKILLKMTSFLELQLLCCLISLSILASSQNLDNLFYTRFDEPNNNINLTGVAVIGQNGYIQLTNETSRLMGHAFYASPFQFKNSTNGTVYSFSTCFALAIVPEYPKLGGHGLAFTIAQSNDFSTALPSQYLGLLNATDVGNFSNHVFAVEFDTVQDFEFGDINDNHVGININSLRSNMSAAAAYFDNQLVKQDLNLKCGKVILVWIEYDSVTSLVNVTLSTSSKKPILPLYSYRIDLSPILKDHMYVGFSASTGLLASSHYIFGWSFKLNGEAKFLDLNSLPSLPGQKKKHTGLIMAISIAAAFCVLSSILLAIYFIRKYKNADVIEPWELEVGPHRYSYQELKQATRGFRDSELLGHGGFGKVYKGVLRNSNMDIAVKRICHESKQGLREFVSEISSIGRLRHRNLVQLLGWCRCRGDLLLVYDYMPNGSLDNFLFDKPRMVLSWEQRFKIIKGVASGLLYLHEGYEQVVVHRDVKASNVLLDGELTAKLGDFGLARLYEHGSNPCTTRVVGTLGYLAPELPRTGRATEKSDVFAFGALLLEVVCGRRPIESNAGPEELVLVDMVWNKWREGKILDVIDKRLKGELNESEVMLVLKLGLMCSNNEALARPNMRQVMSYLEGEVDMPDAPMAPGVYNGGFGFDENECLHSLASSSSSKASAHTYLPNGGADGTFVSTQPLSCLFTDEVPR